MDSNCTQTLEEDAPSKQPKKASPSKDDSTSSLHYADLNPNFPVTPNTAPYQNLQKVVQLEASLREAQNKSAQSKEALEEELQAVKKDLQHTSTQFYFEKYSPEELETYMKRLFELGDTNGDGVIDKEELVALLELSNFPFDLGNIANLMDKYDVNRNGVIEESEFMAMIGAHVRGQAYKPPPIKKPKENIPEPWSHVGDEYEHMSPEDAEFMRQR